MTYVGDFTTGVTVRKLWNSNAAAGQSITRATNGTISVYKDGGTTQSVVGVTDTEDFDSLVGVHLIAIDTSADGTFYSAGSDFEVVLSAATIDGLVINATLFSFSLLNRAALRPTTAGRTLDVSAGGEAGIDWANVGSPTTTLNLSGTTVKTATDIAAQIGANGAGLSAIPASAADIRVLLGVPAVAPGDHGGMAVCDANNLVQADVSKFGGATVTSRDIGLSVIAASVTADVGITQAGADKVWGSTTRTLSSFGTLVADAAAAVWASVSRTLSAFGFTVNTNANATETAIKAKTDLIPASPAAVGSVMQLDLTVAIPNAPTAGTIGAALLATEAQGVGKWVLDPNAVPPTLTLYRRDGVTAVRVFNLDSATNPLSRT